MEPIARGVAFGPGQAAECYWVTHYDFGRAAGGVGADSAGHPCEPAAGVFFFVVVDCFVDVVGSVVVECVYVGE